MSEEVAPAQQSYFWQEITRCSMHCRGEAAKTFCTFAASSLALTASNVAGHLCKYAGWRSGPVAAILCAQCPHIKERINMNLILDLAILAFFSLVDVGLFPNSFAIILTVRWWSPYTFWRTSSTYFSVLLVASLLLLGSSSTSSLPSS